MMVTEAEADELYRPYDTLKAIGFSTDDAKSFLANVETAAQSQLPTRTQKRTRGGGQIQCATQFAPLPAKARIAPGSVGVRYRSLALRRSHATLLPRLNLLCVV